MKLYIKEIIIFDICLYILLMNLKNFFVSNHLYQIIFILISIILIINK